MKPLKRLATTERISQRADFRVSGQSRIVNRQFNPHIRIYSLSLPNGKLYNGVRMCSPLRFQACLQPSDIKQLYLFEVATYPDSSRFPLGPSPDGRSCTGRSTKRPKRAAATCSDSNAGGGETPKIACSAARHQPHCACVHSLLSLSNCKLKILTEIRSLFCCFDLLEDYAFQVLDLLQFGFRNGWTCQIVPY